MWFGYYPEIIFCHFFCNLNLVIFKCTIMAGDINSLNLLVSTCMHGQQACLIKYITVAAFSIYALHGEDVTKRGGWSLCIK